ncbi:CocE/NonD family hydrolase [Gordonia sp. (in: high G+C Gram-positive bacteria)]|uniref:CocE/NonD family hydrolase n=1 Tax=Gordonia sp. (in: high G+C Gram-positive bacteria) TaxID=84139 RepID=UPI003F9BF269
MTVPPDAREHTVGADDGTELRGLLWTSDDPRALVVIRTPYDASRHESIGRAWASRGYECLVQDVRGRYRSDGAWLPYRHESADGRAALDAVTRIRPGLPVVVYGASYAAHTALEAARASRAPVAAVIVAVPVLGPAETTVDANGVRQIRHRIGWWHEHGHTRTAQGPLSDVELDARTAVAATDVSAAADAWGWPEPTRRAWRELWAAAPVDVSRRFADVRAPLLVLSGAYDFFDHDARRLAREWTGPSHFAVGPWGHRIGSGSGAVIDPWLTAHGLPGTPDRWTSILCPEHPTTSTFDAAADEWRHERTVP